MKNVGAAEMKLIGERLLGEDAAMGPSTEKAYCVLPLNFDSLTGLDATAGLVVASGIPLP